MPNHNSLVKFIGIPMYVHMVLMETDNQDYYYFDEKISLLDDL
jgi:hypothetical protein